MVSSKQAPSRCWYVAAFSAVATLDTAISRLFSDITSDGNSATVRFFKDGEWRSTTIDTTLPTRYGQLAYAHSANAGEIWMSLLEKAYAKIHGGYDAILDGDPAAALVDLTGGVCYHMEMKDADSVWARLYTVMDMRHGVAVASHRESKIVCAVIEVKQLPIGGDGQLKIVIFRHFLPSRFPLRTPEIDPKHAGILDDYVKSDPYMRWMVFDDFVKDFESVDICYCADNLVSTVEVSGNFKASANTVTPSPSRSATLYPKAVVKLPASAATRLTMIQLSQEDFFMRGKQPQTVGMTVLKTTDRAPIVLDEGAVVGAVRGRRRDLTIQLLHPASKADEYLTIVPHTAAAVDGGYHIRVMSTALVELTRVPACYYSQVSLTMDSHGRGPEMSVGFAKNSAALVSVLTSSGQSSSMIEAKGGAVLHVELQARKEVDLAAFEVQGDFRLNEDWTRGTPVKMTRSRQVGGSGVWSMKIKPGAPVVLVPFNSSPEGNVHISVWTGEWLVSGVALQRCQQMRS
ncbi:Peptidase C2 calpain family [Carpediemonas membranifera]|uniref:Peptidase C2 calpain family n=1 Tax=Carpediemonas membranifera TaxID=201153 RepID=A0A8J6E8T7_9EUKA|nr:Peptidase C2 calpain family [Carpediemonas membranifera]|eukprot:KAG9392380.1 Peptidase C2 calpain family [Carpediemonas membranifera]